MSHLIELGADTLFVTGCTPSGCVRSPVSDAFAYKLKVVVPEECVYDRSPTSHAVTLWDMQADVPPADQAMALLDGLAPAAAAVPGTSARMRP